MKKKTLSYVVLALFCAAVVFAGGEKEAGTTAEFPEGPITIIVGYGAGGTTDLATRIVADGMSEYLKKPVLVTNLTGGSGTIALAELAKSPPSGYVIGAASGASHGVAVEAIKDLPFNPEEFTFIGRYLDYAGLIWARADAGWKSFEDMMDYARKNPGELVYAAEEVFGVNPVGVYQLVEAAAEGVQYTTMVTSGSGETIKNVVAGDADFCYLSIPPVLPHYQNGSVVPLVSMAPYKLPGFENVPVATETYSKYERAYMDTCGLLGPVGMPEAVRAKIEEALKASIENPEVQKRLRELGAVSYFLPGADYKKEYMGMRAGVTKTIKLLKERQ